MAFCNKEKQLIHDGYSVISNKFLLNYIPDAPDKFAAVYLLGLALADSEGEDNSIETIAKKLNISADDVIAAYQYWDELDLVTLVNDAPAHVTYLALKDSASALRKINPSKYRTFSKRLQDLFIGGRQITPQEYDVYYQFLEDTTFEPEALLAVIKYCIALKGNNIGYQYIMTVARNVMRKGATTLATVAEHLDCQQKYDEDLKLVFKNLGTARKFEHSDRLMYDKWTRELGFTQDVIINVAKDCKKGGMSMLDGKLCEYYRSGAMSLKEIECYTEQKNRIYELAKNINKAIGVYYQSLDVVVDEYIVRWLNKGFDGETLLQIAKYCFKTNIRTLNGLSSVIDKLYKNGITTQQALHEYISAVARQDEQIKKIINKCGLDRRVTANDRLLYKTWTAEWHMNADVIEFAAEKAVGTNAPIAYLNRILAEYKHSGVTTVEQAKAQSAANKQTAATKVLIGGRDIERRQYTDDELNALFTVLTETED